MAIMGAAAGCIGAAAGAATTGAIASGGKIGVPFTRSVAGNRWSAVATPAASE